MNISQKKPEKPNEKKICFFIGSLGRGGAERVISLLANWYSANHYKVKIFLLLDSICEYDIDERVEIVVLKPRYAIRLLNIPFWLITIRMHLEFEKPSLVVSFIARINLIVLLSMIGIGVPAIVSERNDPSLDKRSFLIKFATYLIYPLAKGIVFQTKQVQKQFPKYIINKSCIIHNPIQVSCSSREVREKKIVAVGRLVEQKNHRLLIEAFNLVSKEFPEYKLIIYGEGRLRDELTDLIRKLNLQDKVRLPGVSKHIHTEISDAELFVLSSNYEGLSNSLLEAMLMGIAVISTDCSGSVEVIENRINGLIVPRGDVNELHLAICSLIQNHKLRVDLAVAAHETAQKFLLGNIINDWNRIVNNLTL